MVLCELLLFQTDSQRLRDPPVTLCKGFPLCMFLQKYKKN